MNLFENYVDNGLNFARKKCVQAMQQVNWAQISLLDRPHWNTGRLEIVTSSRTKFEKFPLLCSFQGRHLKSCKETRVLSYICGKFVTGDGTI